MQGGGWGDGVQQRFARYSSRCETLYFAEPEILAFASLMHENGTDLCFRVWRARGGRATLIHTIPDPEAMRAAGVDAAVLVDLLHSGERDARSAHYRFLDSASLAGLCETPVRS